MRGLFVAFVALVASAMGEATGNGQAAMESGLKGRGFGEDYEWKTMEEAFSPNNNNTKPVFLLIHRSWCGACQELQKTFSASQKIKDLAEKFTMVNIDETIDPEKPEWKIDGSYIPRILFMTPSGVVQPNIFNEDGNPTYKYYYPAVEAIVKSMTQALKTQGLVDGIIDTKEEARAEL